MAREERFARLRHWLNSGRGVTTSAAQRELGVSASTIKRDIGFLRDRMGVPIEWSAARQQWRLQPSSNGAGHQYELPGLWLAADEVHALLTMQHLLANLDAGGLLGPHIAPLHKRMAQILGEGMPAPAEVARRIRVRTVGARRMNLPHFQAVGSALLQRRRLAIQYRARGSNDVSQRVVSPQRLMHYRDNWYLDAWCHQRQALRSFSVDAIESVQALAEAATELTEEALDEVLGAGYGIFAGRPVRWAMLRFSPERSRWVASETWHPQQQGQRDAQGRWVLKLPYADPRELVMDILRHVPEVEVLAPEELEEQVRARLAAALTQLGGLDE